MAVTYNIELLPKEYSFHRGDMVLMLNSDYQWLAEARIHAIEELEVVIDYGTHELPDEEVCHIIPKAKSAHILHDKDPDEELWMRLPDTEDLGELEVCIAGGGIAGSSLFRYFSEAGCQPVLLHQGLGMTWHSIAGGRTHFSLPELSEIARQNRSIFAKNQEVKDIGFRENEYMTLLHDEATYQKLTSGVDWSDELELLSTEKAAPLISPYLGPNFCKNYLAVIRAKGCWQVLPGRVVGLLRRIGIAAGGRMYTHSRVLRLEELTDGRKRVYFSDQHSHKSYSLICRHFVNALGVGARTFAKQQGLDIELHSEKHHAFITPPLKPLGPNGQKLPMVISREETELFSAFYMQQYEVDMQLIGCVTPRPMVEKSGHRDFLAHIHKLLANWLPNLQPLELETTWIGAYVEPRMFIDPEHGLFTGLKGQGLMLSQYLAKLYVDSYLGLEVPSYFRRLAVTGDGLREDKLA